MMMYSIFLLGLCTISTANARNVGPYTLQGNATTTGFKAMTTSTVPIIANELSGPCRPVTFIFARGSREHGNIGKDVGGPLSYALKAHYGDSHIATQGVDYGAHLWGNLLADGCKEPGITNFVSEIELAASKCPQTKIVIGGYSQGAACAHDAVKVLQNATIDRITAAVTFGDTRKKQGNDMILPIPPSRTKIFCAKGDLVCDGTILADPAHLSYATDVPPAAEFVEQMLDGEGGSS